MTSYPQSTLKTRRCVSTDRTECVHLASNVEEWGRGELQSLIKTDDEAHLVSTMGTRMRPRITRLISSTRVNGEHSRTNEQKSKTVEKDTDKNNSLTKIDVKNCGHRAKKNYCNI